MSQLPNRDGIEILFDRKALRRNRNRAAARVDEYDFLFREVADNIKYRLSLVKKPLVRTLFIGDVKSKFSSNLESNWGMEHVVTIDMAENFLPDVAGDDENLPFAPATFDAVVSLLTLQWANDLPQAFKQARKVLKPDSLFCGALLGGTTLRELRRSLMQAEDEFTGGTHGTRVISFADAYDISRLLGRHGFQIPVVDSEVLTVQYPDIYKLLDDLHGMGATGFMQQAKTEAPLGRKVLRRANEIYRRDYADGEGLLPASFDVIYFSAWVAAIK